MKKLFLSLVALVSATMSFAQSSLIATLSHDGEISTFYGNSALREAHEAAQHGDIITLSSGSFTSVKIEKAVTIRGAGMQMDTIAKTNPTIILGTFDIQIPDSVEQRLTMEGLFHNDEIRVFNNLKNATFLKNRFGRIISPSWSSNSSIKNSTFIHCKIPSGIRFEKGGSASFVNCYIYNLYGPSATFEFTNSAIVFSGNIDIRNYIKNSIIYNCVINLNQNYNNDNYRYFDSSCSAYYSVGMSKMDLDIFSQIPNNTTNYNLPFKDLNTLFKTYTGTYSDEETFELTDEAKAKYLGSDGTEVGMYGGALPFDPTPTNPQITKCNVASKSTADGKLSVDIEVSTAE